MDEAHTQFDAVTSCHPLEQTTERGHTAVPVPEASRPTGPPNRPPSVPPASPFLGVPTFATGANAVPLGPGVLQAIRLPPQSVQLRIAFFLLSLQTDSRHQPECMGAHQRYRNSSLLPQEFHKSSIPVSTICRHLNFLLRLINGLPEFFSQH